MSTAVIKQHGEGERMWFAGGGTFTWKLDSAETGGAMLLVEDEMERDKVTPLHTHPYGEAIYVLDGEIVVHVDGEDHRVGAGGLFFAPPGVAHAFMVTSDTARVLGLMSPGSGEQFYRDSGEPATADNVSKPADFALLRRVADASPSIEITGPPPFKLTAAAGPPQR